MHIFKGFEDQSDTYHDTRTHYLMEQDPFLLQDQAEVMDVVAADKVEALKNEKMGPPGPCSSRSGSRYSMSRTCGPRDIISLVIPKLGDNISQYLPLCFIINQNSDKLSTKITWVRECIVSSETIKSNSWRRVGGIKSCQVIL
jgi:hypothetical protein